jgi:stage III sporulation protein AE
VAVNDVNSFIGKGSETIDQLNTFSKVILPTLTASAPPEGQSLGCAKYAAAALFIDVLVPYPEP